MVIYLCMTQSMTGFGSGANDAFRVEVRSINHRFMDIAVKLPHALSRHDIPLRNRIKERFSRGRFDVFVSPADDGHVKARINTGLAKEIYSASLFLKEELSMPGSMSLDAIMGFRDVVMYEDKEYNAELLYAALNAALAGVEQMRCDEGEAIAQDMLMRLDLLDTLKSEVSAVYSETLGSCRERFARKLAALLGDSGYDDNRVLQEAALMAEKLDISEELTRMTSHIAQMRDVLSKGGIIGRKLEFILQELNREANTISSKADDYRISKASIEMKAELEKMREQTQNLE